MGKIKVSGPSTENVLEAFTNRILRLKDTRTVTFTSTERRTTYEVVVNEIRACIWNLPDSHFVNEPTARRYLLLKGWVNRITGPSSTDITAPPCTVRMYQDGEIILEIKSKK